VNVTEAEPDTNDIEQGLSTGFQEQVGDSWSGKEMFLFQQTAIPLPRYYLIKRKSRNEQQRIQILHRNCKQNEPGDQV
jgi:hypothetical protein